MKRLLTRLLPFAVLLSVNTVWAKKIKIGVLAPEGTTYANTLKKMAKEIKKATNKKVRFKFYFGGVQGDEPDVLRKVRVGQLHGGMFTGKTLGDVYGDVRAMEIPFNFYNDREKGYKTLTKLEPYFSKGLKKQGFETLGFYEIGQVYIVSTKKVSDLKSLQGNKIWLWEGDKLVETLMHQMKLVSVPLSLPDVLSSISTGIIHSAYAPPLGIMALQWQTKVKYLIDFPVAYSVGALLVANKIWNKISPKHQQIVKEVSMKYAKEASLQSVQDNVEALEAFKSAGIEFVPFPKEDIAKGKKIRADIISSLQGKLFSKEVINLIEKEIK
jgi:TRAP-type C4-dicarboxylate transport system substrate-binding protein